METKPNPRIIEDLKAAGEEIKKNPPKFAYPRTSSSPPSVYQETRRSVPLAKRSLAAELPRKVFSPPKKEEEILSEQVSEKVDLPLHPSLLNGEGKKGLPKKIEEYQEEIRQEQSVLEKTFQKVKELEKRLEERIEFLKGLQTKGIEINKELKEFQEGLALAKKENTILLDEIKNKL